MLRDCNGSNFLYTKLHGNGPRNVSVKIPVQEVATATVTLQSRCTHGIRNVQTELHVYINSEVRVESYPITPAQRDSKNGLWYERQATCPEAAGQLFITY